MKLPAFLPTPVDIGRETLTLICGALLAAAIFSQFPRVKAWVKSNGF